ncbi:hypothetical protein SAMN05878482_103481 [Peribacillus simplex]|uniref:Uncharacterized protein n=1 Tax=Peribacillus simplex TaxID=1478 RepID=A0A9X8WKU1_9BACI|nr:hypothetical protein SAMN05878482_103481 [Peribacillus simplex]
MEITLFFLKLMFVVLSGIVEIVGLVAVNVIAIYLLFKK